MRRTRSRSAICSKPPVGRRRRRIGKALDDAASVEPLAQVLRRLLEGRAMARGLVHGDFRPDTLLVQGTDVTAIIGWEFSRPDGLPVLDAITHLLGLQRLRTPSRSLEQAVALMARRDWPVAEELAMLNAVYRKFGVDERGHAELVHLAWAHQVSAVLDSGLINDPATID